MRKTYPHLPTLRELVRCYQAFERYSSSHVRELGLTPGQFDIIATLGNTPGMTFKQLGERTLITKGTLTGVVDRLEQKGLVKRTPFPQDGRCSSVALTRAGVREFERIFNPHLEYVGSVFARLASEDVTSLITQLQKLRNLFESAARKKHDAKIT
jgi:MarR family transcriptional regulator, 2-MHQ and catechol-resistance regulon repressor